MGSRIRENVKQIFHCFCEVSCPRPGEDHARIIDKFPYDYQEEEVLKSISKFTYPCEFEHTAIQHYSFVFTNEDSKWTFGFCRHDPKTDAAFVFLSSLPWHDTFYKLLNQISEVSQSYNPVEQRKYFLEALYICDIPTNGTLVIPWNGEQTFVSRCPNVSELPSIPENRNLTEYYSAADAHNMAAIFASLLHERRIVFVSRRLPRLSACVQAAASLLYPMHWQHVFIPVLPHPLVDYLLAPMPFLIGAPVPVFQSINRSDLAEVVVFDADTNTLQSPFDDLQNLPADVVSSLRRELRSQAMLGDGMARAFIRALVMLIGGYRDALRFHPGQRITFHSDAFVESRPSPVQPFLRKVLQLQLFQQFIEERLEMLNGGLGFSDEFEKEICLYSGRSSSRLRQQYKEWKRTVRREGTAFFKTMRNKANPAMKSAVKTVREHGREVRAACKDIRSRLRDSQLEKKSTADTNPPRPRPRLKATASYKRRPLHVTKAESRTRSESAPAAPGAPPIPPARSYRHIPALDHQVAAAMALAGSSSSSVATSAGPEETPAPAPAAGSSSSSLTAPSAGGRSARSSDAEELLREYGLDFSALRLRAGAATPDDVPSLPPTPPSTSPPSSLPPTPPATSPPRTPPLPARPGG
ncbi:hypothetical protein R5R35_000698 [Gryllus longicercus]|uniref:UDENN domain-containing protein n=1 Tax=Gryllus longicercus TaxID=2509291 RepID=A0AAN9VQF6_9ORTH